MKVQPLVIKHLLNGLKKIFKTNKVMELSMLNLPLVQSGKENIGSGLQLSQISVKEEYCKKWNIHLNDFVCLTKNGELLRPTLYRIGGLNNPNLKTDNYFMLIKHVEAFYPKDILRMSKSTDPKHLESRWCIIDKNGNEKVEFKAFESAYLVKDSCIYSVGSNYYNIETGKCYGRGSTSMQSKDFLFFDNSFDKDESKRGVMKIDKKNGIWELFSGK